MVDLSIEDLMQLVSFYKQKCSDLEFDLLKSQINTNKLTSLIVPAENVAKPVVDKIKK